MKPQDCFTDVGAMLLRKGERRKGGEEEGEREERKKEEIADIKEEDVNELWLTE